MTDQDGLENIDDFWAACGDEVKKEEVVEEEEEEEEDCVAEDTRPNTPIEDCGADDTVEEGRYVSQP